MTLMWKIVWVVAGLMLAGSIMLLIWAAKEFIQHGEY